MPFAGYEDFDACVQDQIGKGKDLDSAKRICGALQARAEEGFSWTGDLKPFGKNLIRGRALHPIKTVHPEEWPSIRVYLEEELRKAAHTLADKPLLLDHELGGVLPEPNRVLGAEYEDGAIEYVAQVSDDILQKIRDGKINHVSVEYNWELLKNVNGVAPLGLEFTGLSLLEKFLPGDPLSSVGLWEGLAKHLKEAKRREPNPAVGSEAHEGEKVSKKTEEPERDEHGCIIGEEQWDEKQGKCVSIGQPPKELEETRKRVLEAMLKEFYNVSLEAFEKWVETGRIYPTEFADLEAQIQALTEERDRLKEDLEKPKSLTEVVIQPTIDSTEYIRREDIEAVLPQAHIYGAWSFGPQRLVQDIKRVLRSRSPE